MRIDHLIGKSSDFKSGPAIADPEAGMPVADRARGLVIALPQLVPNVEVKQVHEQGAPVCTPYRFRVTTVEPGFWFSKARRMKASLQAARVARTSSSTPWNQWEAGNGLQLPKLS